jgi:hypothetical protein
MGYQYIYLVKMVSPLNTEAVITFLGYMLNPKQCASRHHKGKF